MKLSDLVPISDAVFRGLERRPHSHTTEEPEMSDETKATTGHVGWSPDYKSTDDAATRRLKDLAYIEGEKVKVQREMRDMEKHFAEAKRKAELRDHFAGLCLDSMLHMHDYAPDTLSDESMAQTAGAAYRMADAMMKARDAKP